MAINTSIKRCRHKKTDKKLLITIYDIKNKNPYTYHRYPPSKEKAIRRRLDHHMATLRIPLTPDNGKHHHNAEIALNLFFVNENLFLHTKSGKLISVQYKNAIEEENLR